MNLRLNFMRLNLKKKRTLEKKLKQEQESNKADIEFYENIEKIFLNEENMFFSDDILFDS